VITAPGKRISHQQGTRPTRGLLASIPNLDQRCRTDEPGLREVLPLSKMQGYGGIALTARLIFSATVDQSAVPALMWQPAGQRGPRLTGWNSVQK
jgi:hypothetical protein